MSKQFKNYNDNSRYIYNLLMLLLTATKYFVAIMGGSRSLLMFAIHSTVNSVISTTLFISNKFSKKAADEDHPTVTEKLNL